jgi:hypothetical protein
MPSPVVFWQVFGILFAAIGLATLAYTIPALWRARQSQHWPQTAGRIVAVSVEKSEFDDGPGYRTKVEYEYEVDGMNYRSSRRRFGDFVFMPDRRKEDEIARVYREAGAVAVYFDPANPRNAMLEPGLTKQLLGLLVGGLVCLLGGPLVLFGAFFGAGH